YLQPAGRWNQQLAKSCRVGAKLWGVSDAHREPLATLDSDRDVAFADPLVHYLLDCGDVDPIPRCRLAVNLDVYIRRPGNLLRIDVCGARNAAQYTRDLARLSL